eukprot:scaffold31792_cov168-Amphora_coffeaeformis.AAC.18
MGGTPGIPFSTRKFAQGAISVARHVAQDTIEFYLEPRPMPKGGKEARVTGIDDERNFVDLSSGTTCQDQGALSIRIVGDEHSGGKRRCRILVFASDPTMVRVRRGRCLVKSIQGL